MVAAAEHAVKEGSGWYKERAKCSLPGSMSVIAFPTDYIT